MSAPSINQTCLAALRRVAAGSGTRSAPASEACQVPDRSDEVPVRDHPSRGAAGGVPPFFVVAILGFTRGLRSRAASGEHRGAPVRRGPVRCSSLGRRVRTFPRGALATFAGFVGGVHVGARLMWRVAAVVFFAVTVAVVALDAVGVELPDLTEPRPVRIDTGQPAPSSETPTPSSDPSKSCCWASTPER